MKVCIDPGHGGYDPGTVGTGGKAETAAYKVLPYLVEVGKWANRGVKVRNTLVLRDATMPAILTENGFIDNIIDAGKLKEPDFRRALAVAHAKGICDYFGIQFRQPVQPTTDSSIVFEYKSSGIISKTPIMGDETIKVEQCRQFLLRYNPDAPDIIPYYKIHGERLGIKWGYAVAQMIRETGYLNFSGVVKAAQNNYAGIGAVGDGAQGAIFSTESEGVLAQLEHLYAYAAKDPLPMGIPKVDPRFDLIERGSCPNWEDLNGRWAVPGNEYGENVVRIYHEMAREVISDGEEISILKFPRGILGTIIFGGGGHCCS